MLNNSYNSTLTKEKEQTYISYISNQQYPVSGYPSSCVSGSQGSSSVVDQSFKFEEGFTITSEGAQSPSVHRCFSKRLGCSLKVSNCQWSVEPGRFKAPHNILGLKTVFLVLKSFGNQFLNQNLISIDNLSMVAYLNKQGGTTFRKYMELD